MKKKITNQQMNLFKNHLYQDEKSSATINKYMHDLTIFKKYAANRSVDKELTLSYKSYLEQTYAISSANSMLAAMNSFLRFAGWQECCVKQFKIQRKTYCSEEKELTREEYTRLLYTARENGNLRIELLIQTLCATGIRVSELPYITIEAVHAGEAVVSCKGKTRIVFIVKKLRKKLIEYAEKKDIKTGAIFVTKYGTPMDRSNIWREMRALCQLAGVPPEKVYPHNLRHLFARTFYDMEKDIAKLADILGHASINTTRIYTITTGTEHREKMERLRLTI